MRKTREQITTDIKAWLESYKNGKEEIWYASIGAADFLNQLMKEGGIKEKDTESIKVAYYAEGWERKTFSFDERFIEKIINWIYYIIGTKISSFSYGPMEFGGNYAEFNPYRAKRLLKLHQAGKDEMMLDKLFNCRDY